MRDGKPYSAIAHLAEDVKPFVALAKGLRERGFSAPEIYAADIEQGFVMLEDLGAELFVTGDPPAPIEARYAIAVDALLSFHSYAVVETLPVTSGVDYTIPRYDFDAFLIEAELLLDWYIPRFGTTIADTARATFVALWREALTPVLNAEPTWVLRDFHSPNLLWLPDRVGTEQVGILDFQDSLIGPAAYDLASLLQDARVTVPEMMELSLLGRYARARQAGDPDFDPSALRAHLCDARGATRLQDPRHFFTARPPRRQTAIFASHAAHMGLSAAFARASFARAAGRVVQRECSGMDRRGIAARVTLQETDAE